MDQENEYLDPEYHYWTDNPINPEDKQVYEVFRDEPECTFGNGTITGDCCDCSKCITKFDPLHGE